MYRSHNRQPTVLLHVQPLPSASTITEPSKHFALWSHNQTYKPPHPRRLSCSWRSFAILSLRRPELGPRPHHVGFVADTVDNGTGFSPVLQFSPVSIIPQILYTSASRDTFPEELRCPARYEYVFRKISKNETSVIFFLQLHLAYLISV